MNHGFRHSLPCLVEFLGTLGLHFKQLGQGKAEAAEYSHGEEFAPGIVLGERVTGTLYIFHGDPLREMLGFFKD
jgi:hypothetical protein